MRLLNKEMNYNRSQFVSSSILRSQIAIANYISVNIDSFINQSQIETSSNLKSQNVTSSSRSQIATLKKLRIINSLKP